MDVNINKKRLIIVPHGMTREIARALGCSERIVYSGLRGLTTGPKSRAARNLALQKLSELAAKKKKA